MKKVVIVFNPDGVVTWEPMPEDAGFNPEKQAAKPHQFDKEYYVECTPEQRAEIRKAAQFDLTDPRDHNPLEPIETVIPFDYDRWKSGDFVRVVNGHNQEVTQLTDFGSNNFPLIGVVCGKNENWRKSGAYFVSIQTDNSLRLVVLQTPSHD